MMVPGPYEYSDPVPGEGLTVAQKQKIIDEQWQKKVEKAAAMIDKAIDYDDEDPVCLDNKAQFLYRVIGDIDPITASGSGRCRPRDWPRAPVCPSP